MSTRSRLDSVWAAISFRVSSTSRSSSEPALKVSAVPHPDSIRAQVRLRLLTPSCFIHVELTRAVDKMEEMIGSYGPRPEPYEKSFASSEAPSGMMARGNYSVRSRVVDDDNNVFADWEWAFKVSRKCLQRFATVFSSLRIALSYPLYNLHRSPKTGETLIQLSARISAFSPFSLFFIYI